MSYQEVFGVRRDKAHGLDFPITGVELFIERRLCTKRVDISGPLKGPHKEIIANIIIAHVIKSTNTCLMTTVSSTLGPGEGESQT